MFPPFPARYVPCSFCVATSLIYLRVTKHRGLSCWVANADRSTSDCTYGITSSLNAIQRKSITEVDHPVPGGRVANVGLVFEFHATQRTNR